MSGKGACRPVAIAVLAVALATGRSAWSADTPTLVNVRPELTVSTQPVAIVLTLGVGATSGLVAAPVLVTSNVAEGYVLRVTRTRFTLGDVPVRILAGTPTGRGQTLDLPLNTLTLVPAGDTVAVGHRDRTISPATGDRWATAFRFGPVPCVRSGQHAALLQSSAVGGAVSARVVVPVVINVRRTPSLCSLP